MTAAQICACGVRAVVGATDRTGLHRDMCWPCACEERRIIAERETADLRRLRDELDRAREDLAVRDEQLRSLRASHAVTSERLAVVTAERDNLGEFIKASKECQDGLVMANLVDDNDRYRKAFTEAVASLQNDGFIRAAHCNWCGERWPMLEGEPASVAFEYSKKHALRCKSNPLRIERDAANEEADRMRPVYDAAIAFATGAHTGDANCAAGDCDSCPARAAEKELRRIVAERGLPR